ncbi:MAG: clan AA aspartic protease [Deinococcota bacterium]|nr:clan AA aspartic protease [Deinococcota bacterium]
MITGTVNAHREAIIRVVMRGPQASEETSAIIDTGFSGFLSLPTPLIAALGLPFRRRGRAMLADRSEIVFDIYEGIVVWDGQPRRIAVDAADTEGLTRCRAWRLEAVSLHD